MYNSTNILVISQVKEKVMKSLRYNIGVFLQDMRNSHVAAYSAQTSYFIIMSVFPFVLILLSLIRFTALTEDMLMEMVSGILPDVFYPIIEGIVVELYERANAIVSVSIILALWSSAKCVLAATNAFNSIYEVDETRNYIVLRFRSALYTAAFVVLIFVSLVLMVFGERINRFFVKHFPVIASVFRQVLNWRLVMLLVFQIVIFMFIYKVLPNRKSSLLLQLPGAAFTSMSWNIFSYIFSIYVEYGRMSYTYGSLTTLIIVMIWLYFCMYIMFIGAQINKYIEPDFRKILIKRKMKKRRLQKMNC